MKFDFPPRAAHRDSPIRPGFDVLLAVTGARQAASPTARLVASRRPRGNDAGDAAGHTGLLATGRTGGARFADLTMPTAPEWDSHGTANQEMKSPFTRAFQPMVKHVELKEPLTAERPNGDGAGME